MMLSMPYDNAILNIKLTSSKRVQEKLWETCNNFIDPNYKHINYICMVLSLQLGKEFH